MPDQSSSPTEASPESDQLLAIIHAQTEREGPLLPILHAIQDQFQYIPDQALPLIAKQLHLTAAEVHGVISFYTYFRRAPGGRHTIALCRGEACQAMGSRALEQQVKQRLGIDFHQTTADQEITLEPVYCLGNCACSPSLRVGDDIHGRMTIDRFDSLLDELTTVALKVQG